MSRPSWDDYFIALVREVAKRATCDRGMSGCLVVRDKRIICTGYVGSPPGMPHCDEAGHLMKQMMDDQGKVSRHCVRTIHAEQNAISQAARHGISLDGATLYCSMEPCRICSMLIISSGIKRVVAEKMYHAAGESRELFAAAGVELVVQEQVVEHYEDQ